jgi:hypothetical protein
MAKTEKAEPTKSAKAVLPDDLTAWKTGAGVEVMVNNYPASIEKAKQLGWKKK